MKFEDHIIITRHEIVFFDFLKSILKCKSHFQLMDHIKQAAGQIWLMDHGLLTPDLEAV